MKKKDFLVYILPIIIAVIIFLIIKIFWMGNYRFTTITIEKYHELIQSSEQSLIYITNSTEDTSNNATKILKKVLTGSKIKTYLLDLSKFSEEEVTALVKENTLFEKGITTPTLALVKENTVVAKIVGVFNEDEVVQFAQDNGLRK